VLASLAQLLPIIVALVPLGAALPAWLGVDVAPLVALELVKRLPDPCLAGMVLVDGGYCPFYRIECQSDQGTAESPRCAEFARRSNCPTLLEPRRFCVDRYEWPNLVGENPRVYVSWYQAKELCWSVGKRLCRRSEWMLACEGPKRLPYPYGFVRQPSPCNIDRGSIPFDIEAMLNPDTREAELLRLWQADPIGSHPACVSPFGAYDMSGNVDEWTDNQGDDPTAIGVSTLNGGYWGPVRDTCRLTTRAHGPTFRFYQVGFRCCSDAIDGIETPPVVMHADIAR
jgi:sulfatase modifying factor 1